MRKIIGILAFLLSFSVTGTANATWHEARSKHFLIYADQPPAELKAFAEKLERFDHTVRLSLDMDSPPISDSERLKIFVLRSSDDMARLTGNSYAAGLYTSRASGSYAFLYKMKKTEIIVGTSDGSGTYDNSAMNTQIVFFHEYTHHLTLQNLPFAVPVWLREGTAEFFATVDFDKDGNVMVGKFPRYRSWEVFLGAHLPVEKMIGQPYDKLDGDEFATMYGRGWLLTHYLLVSGKRDGQLHKYLTALQAGKPIADAAKDAFGDLKQLEREMRDYVSTRSLPGFTIPAKLIQTGEVSVRALRPAESAMINVVMSSKLGVSENEAPKLAAAARKAAASFPNDPAAQDALAEAEADAKNYAAADAAADRALAANPNDVQALIYKGRARMELGKTNSSAVDWGRIRGWFIRANKLATENAEPLMLYYKSFTEAGQSPTANAVEALVYALDLAPQDDDLRALAVRQMIVGNRFPEAAEKFAALAYDPHASKDWRTNSTGVMTAIKAGDGKKALDLLDAALKAQEIERKKKS